MCDHSPRLRDGRLQQQWQEIDALNEALAPFRILKGIEVNIRANGELDVADDVLEQLDWVMASVHTSFDKDPTERVLHAMENPHVDCIGHLTSRRIGVRNPSTIEVEKVVEAALATGTFLEINSQPDRLDLRDANARLAGEAGVTLVISSDGHSTKALRYVELGVGQARRAWLTKDQILNTRPWKAIEKLRKGSVSFREDGVAAVDWVASYFERLRELPVLAQVEPGELRSRLPASPPETRRAVRERPPRPRRDPHARGHALAEPALLRLLREHRLRAGHPRRAADRGAEPGRDPLAHLAGAAGARGGDARLARAAARAPGRPARPHRGHGVDVHDGRARRRAARQAGRARRRRLRARALVGREGVPAARARGCGWRRSTTRSGSARTRSTSRTPARSSPRSGRRRRARSIRSPRSRTAPRPPASGCTSTPRTPARRRCAPSCAAHFAGWERADSIVVNPHKWLLTPMDCSTHLDAPARRPARGVQPRPGVPPRQRGRGEPLGVQPGARPALPGAQALGRAALLRPRRAAGSGSARRSGWPRCSRAGCATSRAGR